MALVPKKPVALSVSSINNDQKAAENASGEEKNNNSAYTVYEDTNEEVSFYEQVQSNAMSSTIGNTDKNVVRVQTSTLVTGCYVMLCRQ